MNKLVLIGNGFDLAHGLKTKYKDFLLWYLNTVLQSLLANNSFNDSLISANIGFRANAPTPPSSLKHLKDFLTLYGIEFKYKYKFFDLLVRTANDQNWVDIETEYYYTLLNFFKPLEKENLERHDRITNGVKELNICFDAIKDKLSEYLIAIDNSKKDIKPEIANHFIEEFANKRNNESNDVVLLNFNYTSTLDLYTNNLSHTRYAINYIHGKLNDEKNQIIFGYGDEMDSYYQKLERLNSNEFLRNFKSFGYLKTNNYQNLSAFLHSNPFRVYIMGHSCGISDRVLLNSIFEHKHCIGIKVYYHKRSDKENDFFEKTQEISRHFKPENKGTMRRIITPFTESKPLVE